MKDPTHLPGAPRKAMHSIGTGHHRDGVQDRPTFTPKLERHEAMRAFSSVVYAARCGDVIKFGVTKDLPRRLHQVCADELLAFVPGSFADEQEIHARLSAHLHHGREWYFPTPGVMAVVNEMRASLGMEPVAA